jgi:hypothetical protein
MLHEHKNYLIFIVDCGYGVIGRVFVGIVLILQIQLVPVQRKAVVKIVFLFAKSGNHLQDIQKYR